MAVDGEQLLRRRLLGATLSRIRTAAAAESAERGRKEEMDSDAAAAGRRGAEEAAADLEQPMSPAGRLFHQRHFNCYILCVIGCGAPIDVPAASAGIEQTLLRHPRFSSIQLFDKSNGKKPRWVRTKVNLDDHVVYPELDAGAVATSPEKTIEDYLATLSTTTMDLSKPLWEFHVLNFPTPRAAATAVFRVHHSLGDGMSLISLLLACTRTTADPSRPPGLPQPPQRPRRMAGRGIRPSLVDGPLAVVLWLISLLALLWNTLVDMILFLATAVVLRDSPSPFRGGEGVALHKKRFVHRALSLEDVKLIKNTMNCTVNDVLLGITSAALSRYFFRKWKENNPGSKKKPPRNIRLRSTVLVNIRPTPGIHALAEMMEAGEGGPRWGNRLGYVILQFPVALFEDPREYVRRGKAVADKKKNSLGALLTYASGYAVVRVLGIKAAAAFMKRVLANTTLSFSNTVGPAEEITFFGHPIVFLAPTVYGHPQALTVHFQSYVDKMELTLAVDDELIPDVHQLLDDFADSLALIRAAAAPPPAP